MPSERHRPNSHGGPHTCVFFNSPASYLLPSSFILIHPGASLLLSSPVTFRFPLALSFSLLDPELTEDASRREPTGREEVKVSPVVSKGVAARTPTAGESGTTQSSCKRRSVGPPCQRARAQRLERPWWAKAATAHSSCRRRYAHPACRRARRWLANFFFLYCTSNFCCFMNYLFKFYLKCFVLNFLFFTF